MIRPNWTLAIASFVAICVASPAYADNDTCVAAPTGSATINGTVKDAQTDDDVLSAVIAAAEPPLSSDTFVFRAFAGAGGGFSIHVAAPATYVVYAIPIDMVHAGEFYDGTLSRAAATKITVQEDEVRNDVDFTVAVGATLSGTVTAESGGAPIENVEVFGSLQGDLPQFGFALTDADGNYTLTGLASAEFEVAFLPTLSDENFLAEFYNNKLNRPTDPVNVTLPGVTGINATLGRGGRIEGNVTGSDHAPIEGVEVTALTSGPYKFGSATTDDQGDYSMAVASGTYNVLFQPDLGVSEFFDGKFTQASADDVVVTAPGTTSHVDVQLGDSATIFGRITDATNDHGIPFATATAFDLDGNAVATSESDTNGGYAIGTDLPTGQFKVGFTAPGYVGRFYSNKSSLGAATPVSVTAPDATQDIDQALSPCHGGGGTTTTINATTTSLPATTTTLGGAPVCGDPVALLAEVTELPASGDDLPRSTTASDALFILRTAVGSVTCDLCVCDVNNSGSVTASDALVALRKAVGQGVELVCPVCS